MDARLAIRLTLLGTLLLVGCDDTRGSRDGGVPLSDGGGMTDGMVGTDGGPPPPISPLVDPTCRDGMFTEVLPDPTVDLSDLEASYDGTNPRAFIEAVLARRYSTGGVLVANGNTMLGDCVTSFLGASATPADIYGQLSTIVHECGHFYDLDQGGFGSSVYEINDSPLRLSCAGGDTTSRGGNTFERSRIRDDVYQPLRPAGRGGDFYAEIYLDGDPDDATFDGGDQGFNSLLEETVQYVNSLAVSYAFTNEVNTGGSSSQRDGILTFLWYVMRYLRMARLDYPAAYDHIVNGDGGCFRDAILTVWGRAWLYLETTDGMGHLGIDDANILALVEDADLLSEIQRLREAAGCAAP